MSNDRIYIQCKQCKEIHLLAKYYPSGTYVPNYEGDKCQMLGDFLEHHLQDCGEFFGEDLGNWKENSPFEFATEGDLP